MRLLIVEDDATSREFLHAWCNAYGSVDTAVDGVEGAMAHQAALMSGKPYDLIFLDIMMPVLDGYGCLERLRSTEDRFKAAREQCAKVVMTTAMDEPKNVFNAFRLQADAYLIKPLDRAKFERVIADLGPTAPPAPTLPGTRI